jgi:two-component system sensor histidine kinase UhpB
MPGFVLRLLRFPLFYKVLIANSLLVTLGAFAGTAITMRMGGHFEGSGAALALGFTVIGVALTITLNTVLLRAAMQPLRTLRGTVDALSLGNFAVRVPASPLADEDLAHVAETLNQMLDHVQRYQERVQDLSATMLNAQEDERNRIARELHDQIGQALTFLLVRLKIIEATPGAGAVEAELSALRVAVSDAIDQVRRLALDLRPPALDQLGLVPALRALGRDFAEQTRIAVVTDLPEESLDLPLERATALYRIVQESLTNIAKHANAQTVRITLHRQGKTLLLSIADDGCGFDLATVRGPERGKDGPGLGLFGMEERVRLLGGSHQIETQPGCGTTIWATIPLDPLEDLHDTTSFNHAHTPFAPADSHLARR